MTSSRAAGPGPRTVAPSPAARILRAILVGATALAVAACGAAPRGSGPVAGSPIGSSGPVASGAAAGSPAPGDSRPRWPGTTVLAVIALGGADGEIQKAGIDLQAAADKQDLRAMWGAADGLAKLIDGLMPNIERLEVYEGTRPVAAMYRAAFPEIAAGAKRLRDSITAGDSAGVVEGSQQIARGLAAYGPIRREIAALVEQAILQQRLLVK